MPASTRSVRLSSMADSYGLRHFELARAGARSSVCHCERSPRGEKKLFALSVRAGEDIRTYCFFLEYGREPSRQSKSPAVVLRGRGVSL